MHVRVFIIGTLNLRGSDIEFNPVFLSFLVLDFTCEKTTGTLFIDGSKLDERTRDYLGQNGIGV